MTKHSRFLRTALLFSGMAVFVLSRGLAADSLIPNGNMEKTDGTGAWPEGWPNLGGNSTWEKEGDNHFIRIKATEPDQMLTLFRQIQLPPDAKAVEITFRVRTSDIRHGKQVWNDGRIIVDLKNDAGDAILPSPVAPSIKGTTEGWIEESMAFSIPEGATRLNIMPALFKVQSGSIDFDDIILKVIEPARAAEILAQEKARILPP